MEIRTYQNKIVLVDDEQFAIAEVDFPAVDGRDGVVEISHTFVDESMRGKGVAGKLMEKTVEHLRRENLKAIPSCSYATAWFGKHREAQDVLESTAATELFPDDEGVDDPVELEDEFARKTGEATNSEVASEDGFQTKQSRTQPDATDADADETRQKIIPFRKAAAGAVLNDKTVGAVLLVVSRIFQVVSAFLMAFLLILISVPALRALDAFGPLGSMLTDRNIPEIAYIASVAGTCLYMAISVIWILTRKKYASEDHLVSIDTGRGITAFLLVVLLEIATEMLADYPEPTDQVALGLYGFITILYQHTELAMRLAIGGLLLSVVRKIIGR